MDVKRKQLLLSSPKPEFTAGTMKQGITLPFSALCTHLLAQTKYQITVETLLKEMISQGEMSHYSAPPYRSMQQSNYDRRSASPDHPNWFANDDGEGFIRPEERNGRKEKVLLEDRGLGATTYIWFTAFGSTNTILRFYSDGKDEPGREVPPHDLQKFGVRGLKKGLTEPDDKWNRSSLIYLPVPYNNGRKVAMEKLTPERTNRHFLLNHRKYPTGTPVETFSQEVANCVPILAEKISDILYKNINKGSDSQSDYGKGSLNYQQSLSLSKGEKQRLNLHTERRAISLLRFNVKADKNPKPGTDDFILLMRSLIVTIGFDGK